MPYLIFYAICLWHIWVLIHPFIIFFQRNRASTVSIYLSLSIYLSIEREREQGDIYYSNWLKWSWKLSPTVYCLYCNRESGKPVLWLNLIPKDWEPEESMVWLQVWGQRFENQGSIGKSLSQKTGEPEAPMFMVRRRQIPQVKKKENSPFLCLFAPFHSQCIGWRSHWWRYISLFNLIKC